MKNNCNHQHKNCQGSCGAKRLPQITMAQIDISDEAGFVKIPIGEFARLVANNALLDAVKRMIERDPYDRHADMRAVLGMQPAKED